MDSSFSGRVAWVVAIASAVGLLLYLFVFDTWEVPEDDASLVASIEPTLRPHDRILTRRKSTPGFGDLARCLAPDGGGTFAVGRVFAVGGETIEVLNERVAVNGKALQHGLAAVA